MLVEAVGGEAIREGEVYIADGYRIERPRGDQGARDLDNDIGNEILPGEAARHRKPERLPHPPNASQKVPKNSAANLRPKLYSISSLHI